MTTLAVDTPRAFELGGINELVASTAIFQGAFVCAVKANGTAAVGAFAVSTHNFAGIAESAALSGKNVRLITRGKTPMPVTGATAASVGAIVYATDDNALTLTAGTAVPVGYVSRFDGGTTCLVQFTTTVGATPITPTLTTSGYTVATLPVGAVGMRAYVTDATAPAYNAALTGGGAVRVPVFYNGTAWVSA